MTMAMVGKRAGYSAGLVAYRFGSKQGLLEQVTDRILQLWSTRVVPEIDDKGMKRFMDSAEAYLKAAESNTVMMRAIFRLMQESYTSCPELLPYFQKFDASVRKIIQDAVKVDQKNGKVGKKLNPKAFSVIYVGLLRGIAIQYFINPKDIDMGPVRRLVKSVYTTQLSN